MPNPIKLTDAFTYYRGLSGQKEAAQYLDKVLTAEQKDTFASLYRNNPKPPAVVAPSEIILYASLTGKRDNQGGRVFSLALLNNGNKVDEVLCCSGLPEYQELVHPLSDTPGSLRVIPEGVYDFGGIDDLTYEPGSGDGFGRYVVILNPRFPIKRSLLRIHNDNNRITSPGSAGCLVTYDTGDMYRIVSWLRAAAKPKYLVVDLGLGFLAQHNIQTYSLGK